MLLKNGRAPIAHHTPLDDGALVLAPLLLDGSDAAPSAQANDAPDRLMQWGQARRDEIEQNRVRVKAQELSSTSKPKMNANSLRIVGVRSESPEAVANRCQTWAKTRQDVLDEKRKQVEKDRVVEPMRSPGLRPKQVEALAERMSQPARWTKTQKKKW